jgi:alpha-D-ribose 1-methylphosphonate 5-triphosphate synthase subunit PhnL
MHMRGGVELPVVANVSFSLKAGACAVLGGPSGVGKSSILKMLYGNYGCDGGQILVRHHGRHVDIAPARARARCSKSGATRSAMSASSCAPCRGFPRSMSLPSRCWSAGCRRRRPMSGRGSCLPELNLPERLWSLPPATFSGGEQQRVNIARGFITDHPVLLLDEPTASLDAANREVVIELIAAKKAEGAALLGIFHDQDVRNAVADQVIDVSHLRRKVVSRMTKLSEAPLVHATAKVVHTTLGRYTEVGAGCTLSHSTMGDYSYCVDNTQIAYATIGKFANIASACADLCQHASDGPRFAASFQLPLVLVFRGRERRSGVLRLARRAGNHHRS